MVAEKVNKSNNPSYMTAHHTQTVTSSNGTLWIEMTVGVYFIHGSKIRFYS
jgi:hypothetical protein